MNVVLDIDETLIYSSPHRLSKKPDFEIKIENEYYYVYKRPHLDKFLDLLFKHAKTVSLWTAAARPYCNQIIRNIFSPLLMKKIKFIWTRNRTITKNNLFYLKDMSKVFKNFKGLTKHNTFLIDDNTNHSIISPDNVKHIKPWNKPNNTKDTELRKIIQFVKNFK